MTNTEIENLFGSKVRQERKLTAELVELIAKIDQRRIYAHRGYPSLFEYLTKKYGYSEGAANRRISAARLFQAVPEAKAKLETGEVNLTTMAKAQSIIRAEEKTTRKSVPAEIKLQALSQIENKSAVSAEQTLLKLFPQGGTQVTRDQLRVVDENTLRLSANLSNDVRGRFEQVRDQLSNKLPNASFVEVVDYLFKKFLTDGAEATAAAAKQSVKPHNKSITPRTRRIVLREGSCTFKNPVTGKICGSRHKVQVDHIQPRVLGGDNHPKNLRALCATHNQLMAERILGPSAANSWRKYQRP
jgi:hypothetical protein